MKPVEIQFDNYLTPSGQKFYLTVKYVCKPGAFYSEFKLLEQVIAVAGNKEDGCSVGHRSAIKWDEIKHALM